MKIAMLGDGGWGTTLSIVLAGKGNEVALWGAFPKYTEQMRKSRENAKFLPGFKIPSRVELTSNMTLACEGADLVVLAAPSQYIRGVAARIGRQIAAERDFVIVAKGIETKTLKTMSQVVRDELGKVKLCVLSGPTIAREVAMKLPASVSVASEDRRLAKKVREAFTTDYFRLYESDDVIGVEIGGSVKNVIAIAAGIAEGLSLGSNARAVLFARGAAEMARLGVKLGAKRETFMGLSGLGDLATTCLSPSSRNRTLGAEIGKGKTLKKLLAETEMVVEGVDTCRSTRELAKKHKIEMPIVEAVHAILFNDKDPKEIVKAITQEKPYRELD